MSFASFIFREALRRLLLRMVAVLMGVLAARLGLLRAMALGAPAGGRRRRAVEREIARLERVLAIYADPENYLCPTMRGIMAEAAARGFEPGRRAWIRLRWIYGWATGFFRLPRARLGVGVDSVLEAPEERCICGAV